MTKKGHIQTCQFIRDQYKDGEFLKGADIGAMVYYLKKHRWYDQKTGGQEYRIFVGTNYKYNTRGFFIERDDGSRTDFSFYECIYPTKIYRQDFVKAARTAIEQDIIDFRNEYFSFSDVLRCPLCQEEMNKTHSHIDHYPVKFKDLLNNFIKVNDIKDFKELTEPENWDNVIGVEITNIDIKNKWIAYHKKYAKLRVLCPECNLKLG